jgi:hypothetical protein
MGWGCGDCCARSRRSSLGMGAVEFVADRIQLTLVERGDADSTPTFVESVQDHLGALRPGALAQGAWEALFDDQPRQIRALLDPLPPSRTSAPSTSRASARTQISSPSECSFVGRLSVNSAVGDAPSGEGAPQPLSTSPLNSLLKTALSEVHYLPMQLFSAAAKASGFSSCFDGRARPNASLARARR